MCLKAPQPATTSANPETLTAREKRSSHLAANKQNQVRAASTAFVALHHRHGYWPITTVSWEPDKYWWRHVTQVEKGKGREKKNSKTTNASALRGIFVERHQVFIASGPLYLQIWVTLRKQSSAVWEHGANINKNTRHKELGGEDLCYASAGRRDFWLCSAPLLSSRGTLLARVCFLFLLIHEYWDASGGGSCFWNSAGI